MKNKLFPVIITNSGKKGFLYKLRDSAILMITLYIWWLVLFNLYLGVIGSEPQLNKLLSYSIVKLFISGFIVAFLCFHFWSSYNIRRHHMANRKNIQKPVPESQTVKLTLQEKYSLRSNLTDA